jgi:hypothetical protein
MKKLSLVSLAIATALAISPSVLVGQQYNFTISGSGISASGVLTVAPTATPGVDSITGISGTYSDSGTGTVNGIITSLYSNPSNSYVGSSIPTHLFTDDNLFYPGNSGAQLDSAGIIFYVNGPLSPTGGIEVGLCGTSACNTGGSPYNLDSVTWFNGAYNYLHNNEGIGVTFAATEATVPEGGTTLLYLLLAGAGCFGAIFFKSRDGAGSPALA